MLASTCFIRFFSLALVKFLSLVFTALNLLPSIAATAWPNRSSRRHSAMKLPAGRPDRRAVVLPEVRNGLEVQRQALRQPHHLDVALALPLQPTGRSDLVVAIDVDLQQRAGVIRRPSGRLGHNAREPQNPRSNSSTNTPITRTGFSSDTYSSRNSGSRTPCRRSSPSNETLHLKPRKQLLRDSNSAVVFTQPRPEADIEGLVRLGLVCEFLPNSSLLRHPKAHWDQSIFSEAASAPEDQA